MQPKIILADDHFMIRRGLKLICEDEFGFQNIAEVDSCSKLMKELLRQQYTHLVLDIVLSDGSTLEILPAIQRLYSKLKIMVFTMQPSVVYKRVVRYYGVDYFAAKNAPEFETIKQLRQFLYNEPAKPNDDWLDAPNPFASLSARELEVLLYLLKGWNSGKTAEALNVKLNTISTVKNRIFEKTRTKNLLELKELATFYNLNSL